MTWINETLDFFKRLESLQEPDEEAIYCLDDSALQSICKFIEQSKAEAQRLHIIDIMQKIS